MTLTLHDALKTSYKDKDNQKLGMSKFGYTRGEDLSNHNHQVYHHAGENKLLFSVTGSHNKHDAGVDAYLGLGMLKHTNRYKDADTALKESKKKYNINNATVIGHSLGSSVGRNISGNGDKFIGLDGGYTIGEKVRNNGTNYKTKGDVVSLFGKKQTVLQNKNENKYKKLGSYVGLGAFGGLIDAYKAHDIDNITDEQIFV